MVGDYFEYISVVNIELDIYDTAGPETKESKYDFGRKN